MLNHSDYFITTLEFPYENADGWTVKVFFKNTKNGKASQTVFSGRDGWMKVADQCRKQIGEGKLYTITHQPKPKVRVEAPKPLKGKGKAKAK